MNQERQKQPSRTRRSSKRDDPFERAKLRDGKNEGENTQETDNPRQEPPYAEHFEREGAGLIFRDDHFVHNGLRSASGPGPVVPPAQWD